MNLILKIYNLWNCNIIKIANDCNQNNFPQILMVGVSVQVEKCSESLIFETATEIDSKIILFKGIKSSFVISTRAIPYRIISSCFAAE